LRGQGDPRRRLDSVWPTNGAGLYYRWHDKANSGLSGMVFSSSAILRRVIG